ncbi:hypothetical protein PQU92_18665, partial [Asticcacaulis sp. BYS171W]
MLSRYAVEVKTQTFSRLCFAASVWALSTAFVNAEPVKTDTLMLSGNGPDDAVSWDFTVSGGMKAGQASKIAVPSNW